jgi:hypothetical protein
MARRLIGAEKHVEFRDMRVGQQLSGLTGWEYARIRKRRGMWTRMTRIVESKSLAGTRVDVGRRAGLWS